MELCPLESLQILPFFKILVTDFSEPKKARKLKVRTNHGQWLDVLLHWKGGKGFITLGVMSLGRFSFSYFAILEIFETDFSEPKKARKLKIPTEHRKWLDVLCILGVISLGRFLFLKFAILEIFVTDFSEPKKARKLKVHINMDNDWMYPVYQNMGQESITLGDVPW